MQHKLKALDAETLCYAAINLNSFSDAPALQTILEQSLEKKSGACRICTVIPLCRTSTCIHQYESICPPVTESVLDESLQACASARRAASA